MQQIIKILETNIQHLGFPNLINLATNQARMITLGKIEEYANIINFFEGKYNMTFVQFKSFLKKKKETEDSEKEDDLMEWRLLVEGKKKLFL